MKFSSSSNTLLPGFKRSLTDPSPLSETESHVRNKEATDEQLPSKQHRKLWSDRTGPLLVRHLSLIRDDIIKATAIKHDGSAKRKSRSPSIRKLVRNMSEKSVVKKIGAVIAKEYQGLDKDIMDISTEEKNDDPSEFLDFNDSTLSLDYDPAQDSDDESEMLFGDMDADSGNSSAGLNSPPIFHRKELAINSDIIGEGGFSEVHVVQSIHLMQSNHLAATYHKTMTKEEDRNRHSQSNAVSTKDDSLVIKHPRYALLRKPKRFLRAVIDLEREAKILVQLNHDHIVKIRGMSLYPSAAIALQTSGKFNDYFVLMDRLHETLDSRIKHWKAESLEATLPTILKYAVQLASALNYLHDRRLVFRDVKPQNCGLLKNDGPRLQLFDFGLCRSLPESSVFPSDDREAFHMSMAGTIRYMSPEMMLHQPYNHLSDSYSWALTVYEMLARKKPYDGVIREARHFPEYVGHMEVRPNLKTLTEIPESLVEILQGAWCASIDDRFTMQTIMDALDPLVRADN